MKDKTRRRLIAISLLLVFLISCLIVYLVYNQKISGLYTDYDPILDIEIILSLKDQYMAGAVLWIFLASAMFHLMVFLLQKYIAKSFKFKKTYIFMIIFTWTLLILDFILWKTNVIGYNGVILIFMFWVLAFNFSNLLIILKNKSKENENKGELSNVLS